MPPLAHDLAKRHQREFPLGEQRMGNREAFVADHLVVVENDVDVDRPRAVDGSGRGLLDRLGGTVAAQFPLDLLAGVEHLVRREVGGDLQRLVRKTLCGRESPRFAFITVRATQHGPHTGVDELLRRLQGPFHIALVTA